jgi:hypothetical protein
MRWTTKRQLRAYICTQGGSITLRQVGEDTYLEGLIVLKNFGQTPAYDEASWVRIELRASSDLPFALSGAGLTKCIRGPTCEYSLPVHHGSISARDLADIRAETKRIFVWGGSDYVDACKVRHFYRFYCWNGKELPKGWPLLPSDKPDEGD